MNEMRKLMETVEQFVDEERTSDASTVSVLGKTDFTVGDSDMDPRNLHLEVREYRGNKFADDGLHVYIVEDGYDGFHLGLKMEDFQKLVSIINDLAIKDISSEIGA